MTALLSPLFHSTTSEDKSTINPVLPPIDKGVRYTRIHTLNATLPHTCSEVPTLEHIVAKSDGANMLRLDLLEDLLTKLIKVQEAIR